ncbi:hypothetical protein [Nocardiopsis metallicus]|uniref:hypothetical protein n=1 Tax=Nocardiopsis metallicus TaxID=179819 RepID=UPI0031DC67E4
MEPREILEQPFVYCDVCSGSSGNSVLSQAWNPALRAAVPGGLDLGLITLDQAGRPCHRESGGYVELVILAVQVLRVLACGEDQDRIQSQVPFLCGAGALLGQFEYAVYEG